MEVIINICAIAWTTILVWWSLQRLREGKADSVYFVYLVFYAFFVFPLVLDLTIGLPAYRKNPGFYDASRHGQTQILYSLFLIEASAVLLLFGRSKNAPRVQSRRTSAPIDLRRTGWFILLLLSLLPIGLVLMSSEALVYLQYGAVAQSKISDSDYHSVIAAAATVSIFAMGGLLLHVRRFGGILLALLPIYVADIFIIGKRTAVALVLVTLFLAAWQRRAIRASWIVPLGVVAVTGLLLFSFLYQTGVRDYSTYYGYMDMYDNFRIDYGRDDVTKMAIYAELESGQLRILEYRGQSLLFYVTAFVPRSAWPDKPMPYAQYVTSAMLHSQPQFWGWSMTTSLLDEAIANLSWFGIFIGPLWIAFVCRLGDSTRSYIARLLTPVVACLLMVVQVIAFMPLILLWFVLIMKGLPSLRIVHFILGKRGYRYGSGAIS